MSRYTALNTALDTVLNNPEDYRELESTMIQAFFESVNENTAIFEKEKKSEFLQALDYANNGNIGYLNQLFYDVFMQSMVETSQYLKKQVRGLE